MNKVIVPYFNYTDISLLVDDVFHQSLVIADSNFYNLMLIDSLQHKLSEFYNMYLVKSELGDMSHKEMWQKCKRELLEIDDPVIQSALYFIIKTHTKEGTTLYERSDMKLMTYEDMCDVCEFLNSSNAVTSPDYGIELIKKMKLDKDTRVDIFLVNPSTEVPIDDILFLVEYLETIAVPFLMFLNHQLYAQIRQSVQNTPAYFNDEYVVVSFDGEEYD